jgi:uncharacterized repeat protein (TIGR03943 family)
LACGVVGMGHAHTEDGTTYYMEQLCTIGICGAIGGVAIMMWHEQLLKWILSSFFHPFVLLAGIALLVLVLIKAIGLWLAVAEPKVHDHDHDHDHDHHHHHDHEHCHDHDHGEAVATNATRTPLELTSSVSEPLAHTHTHHDHHDHDHEHPHDHGHDHGWNPWRYAVLLLPVVLFFLGMPNQGFSDDHLKRQIGGGQLEDSSVIMLTRKGTETLHPSIEQLEKAVYNQQQRELYEGTMVQLKGQFVPGSQNTEGTLVRLKMTCCAADVIAIRVKIVSPTPIPAMPPEQWVEITGQIQFRKLQGRDEYVPVIQVTSPEDIVPTTPDSNPYL